VSVFYLTPFWGGAAAARHPLTARPQVVGRSERAQIVLREPSVSREHARLEVREGEVWLEDLGSKHGTFVNSRRASGATRLEPGDIVVFGLVVVMRIEVGRGTPAVDSPAVAPAQAERADGPTTATEIPDEPLTRLPTDAAAVWSDLSQSKEAPTGFDFALLGRLAADALTGAYATLTMVVDQLKSSRSAPLDATALRGLLEQMLASLTRVMVAAVEPARGSVERVSRVELARLALNRVSGELQLRQIEVELDVPDEVRLHTRPEELTAALAGLISNAGRLALEGSLVQIAGNVGSDGVELVVADAGYGYPPEVVELAERDAGGERDPLVARLRAARSFAHARGGTLAGETRPGFGSTVRLLLPVFEPDAFTEDSR
jgi:signal transduction histidine kinase